MLADFLELPLDALPVPTPRPSALQPLLSAQLSPLLPIEPPAEAGSPGGAETVAAPGRPAAPGTPAKAEGPAAASQPAQPPEPPVGTASQPQPQPQPQQGILKKPPTNNRSSRLGRQVSFREPLQLPEPGAPASETAGPQAAAAVVASTAAPEAAAQPAPQPLQGSSAHGRPAARGQPRQEAVAPGDAAGLSGGWDVVSPTECSLSDPTLGMLRGGGCGRRVEVAGGQVLQEAGEGCRQFYLLLEVGAWTARQMLAAVSNWFAV